MFLVENATPARGILIDNATSAQGILRDNHTPARGIKDLSLLEGILVPPKGRREGSWEGEGEMAQEIWP